MKKSREAALMPPLFRILLTFAFLFITSFTGVIAQTEIPETDTGINTESATATSKPLPFVPGYVEEPKTEPDYSLFRRHSERYYPELDVQKAQQLSTYMPGLGQAYAGNYTKATIFLTAELTTFALAGYNIARALHYNEQSVFQTGFQDGRTGEFLSYEQGQTRMRNHTFFSGIFLAAGIGIHIWNILDAPKTAEVYNNQRFSVQMQQTDNGYQSLVFTHRF